MMRRLFNLVVIALLCVGLLWLGGYTIDSFAKSIELKTNVVEVYQPVINALKDRLPNPNFTLPTYQSQTDDTLFPTYSTDDGPVLPTYSSDEYSLPTYETDESGLTIIHTPSDSETDISISETSDTIPSSDTEITTTETEEPAEKTNKIEFDHSMKLKITINGISVDFSTQTSISFVKWLINGANSGSPVLIERTNGDEPKESTKPSETVKLTTQTTETSETTTETSAPLDVLHPIATTPDETPTTTLEPSETKQPVDKTDLPYNDVLTDLEELDNLVSSITVVDELPVIEGYNRDDFEKPVKSYKLNGHKINRNDYAWKTSPWFNSTDWTYTCPYTGTIITDVYGSDKKEDYDFGALDYDHLIALGSTWERGSYQWTNEERNAYAYDQWVGVDVLYSANRSKSDKGPLEYLPDINVEDYCYSWLLISSKYDLVMTDEEMDLCVGIITDAYNRGETVEHLCGHYEE